MALSDIVSITISTESVLVEQAGFGTPLIMANDCPGGFTERVRTYTNLAGLTTDGFAVTDATYLIAAKIFSQNPRPPSLMVGRCALKPTQRWALTPVVTNSHQYSVKVNGTTVTYTSDASATAAEIIAGLKAAIDALSLAVTTSDQTTYLRVLANTAGAFFSLESPETAYLKIAQDHADPGVGTDLAAIALENNTWYGLCSAFNSSAYVDAVSDYAEANKKLYVAQTQDSDVINVANGSDSTTIAAVLKADSKYRTALIYHPTTNAFADAALLGRCLPLDPGSETWKFKTLAGVSTTTLTATQRTNALAKRCNVYNTVAGVAITEEGKVSGNEWIDVIRFRDWIEARIGEEVFAALAASNKIPFTDEGVAVITGLVRAVLDQGVAVGGLSADPAPKVSAPLVANISATNKALRNLPDVKFDAVLAGAIHVVTISGTISA